MLAYVPYTFDLYAPMPRYLHASAARMVSFANRAGVCWFSVRTFARVVGVSPATAGRHLALLTQPIYGFASRRRAADGSGFEYTIAQKFLARGAVSHGRAPGVSRAHTKNIAVKNKGNFAFGKEVELPDERANWPARMRWWRRDGSWPIDAGPKPGEAGCQVPRELLGY
jgi:hypothetical protein